jgi:hypothetical protein
MLSVLLKKKRNRIIIYSVVVSNINIHQTAAINLRAGQFAELLGRQEAEYEQKLQRQREEWLIRKEE